MQLPTKVEIEPPITMVINKYIYIYRHIQLSLSTDPQFQFAAVPSFAWLLHTFQRLSAHHLWRFRQQLARDEVGWQIGLRDLRARAKVSSNSYLCSRMWFFGFCLVQALFSFLHLVFGFLCGFWAIFFAFLGTATFSCTSGSQTWGPKSTSSNACSESSTWFACLLQLNPSTFCDPANFGRFFC